MKACALVAVAISMVAWGLPAWAQGRGSLRISAPGAFTIGITNSGTASFTQYSTGGSSLGGFRGGFGGTLSGSSGFSVSRGDTSVLSPSAFSSPMLPEVRTGLTIKGGPRLSMDTSNANDLGGLSSAGLMGERATGKTDDILGNDLRDTISSLAPLGTGIYADSMREGERAFREDHPLVAFAKFKTANDIAGSNDPESLLSMAHAKFAGGSYSTAAYYIRQVLRLQPMLLHINLRPRDFYADRTIYVRDVQRLRDFIELSPRDADGRLVMAYLAWFDPGMGPTIARQAIAQGLANQNLPQETHGLEMFAEAMGTSGSITPPPSATTRPANSPEPAR